MRDHGAAARLRPSGPRSIETRGSPAIVFIFRNKEGRTPLVRPSSRPLCRAVTIAALAFSLAQAPAVHAADIDVSLSTHYSSGSYGGKGDVRIVYVPIVARLEVDAWTFKAVVPWLRISGGSTVVEGPGGPVETRNGTSSGLGDLLLEGSWTLDPLFSLAPFVEIGARLKLPTASESEGLGTGKFDVTPEVEVTRLYGRWTPSLSVGFRVLGDGSNTTYRDGFLASAGLTCRLWDVLEPGAFVYWKQSATRGNQDSVEVLPVLRVDVSERWSVDAYASAGFTNSSPDAGVGILLRYRVRDAI